MLFVLIAGFSTLIFMGHETSNQAPPIPDQVVTADGKVLFTGKDIISGQGVFQKYGLMDVGSFFGHGAYNGPDFSADYLHREAVIALDSIAQSRFGKPFAQLEPGAQGDLTSTVKKEFKENRYDPQSKNLTWTDHQAEAYRQLAPYYDTEFGVGRKLPLPKDYINNPEERLQLSRFFAWGAWVCSTNRPGKDYTYTNNWPPDQLVGNGPNWHIFFWSAMSLVMLVGGIGLTQFLLSAFPKLGWLPDGAGMTDNVKDFQPYRSQTSLYPYFAVVVLLFLFQTVFGVVTAHYIVEQGFYGFDIRNVFPYSITRSWHLQLSIFWIAT
ncbi:MAG: nitric-oxide reductase large subunit, partial [Cyanobacteria bacterium SZAS LIN-2]|nr:nitric-oxide reductase large subunit [Cyanobacteria bacterium SZAS LIN-2]